MGSILQGQQGWCLAVLIGSVNGTVPMLAWCLAVLIGSLNGTDLQRPPGLDWDKKASLPSGQTSPHFGSDQPLKGRNQFRNGPKKQNNCKKLPKTGPNQPQTWQPPGPRAGRIYSQSSPDDSSMLTLLTLTLAHCYCSTVRKTI